MPEPPVPQLRPIVIRGARTHNLRNVDLTIAPRRLTVVTGVSGSGKSSLAFDTLYAEGQRRYVESLSAYARQFLERMERPDVDAVEGIPPAIAIRQKNSVRNPRSTVGTTTEIHDYLRLLFARIGRTICRQCGRDVVRETAEAVADKLGALAAGTRLLIGFEMPIVRGAGLVGGGADAAEDDAGENGNGNGKSGKARLESAASTDPLRDTLDALRRKGFARLLLGGRAVHLDEIDAASLADRSSLEVIVDRIKLDGDLRARLTDSVEMAYLEGGGSAFALDVTEEAGPVRHRFSERFECRVCGIGYELPQPRLFSFNNPFGACPTCHGFGNVMELDLGLIVPDPTKSLQQNAIEPWSKPHYRSHLGALKRAARAAHVRLEVPWRDLSDEERHFVLQGDGKDFEGVHGFFRWLERKKYKVHIRVFLSRYRGYQTCPECNGTRLRREARDVQVGRADHRSGLRADGARIGGVLRRPRALRARGGDRREGAAGDSAAAHVSRGRRARLPDARPPVVDAVRRRVAAHQPGDGPGLGAGRHALRARRAVDWPPSARQPAPHRHPSSASRSGQHGASSSSTMPT